MTANKTAKIQFYEGTDEPVVPEIRLTRSKDCLLYTSDAADEP